MILGADSQNKNLKEAASKRIDTSPRTKTANAFAARIATSKNDSSARNNVTNDSRSVLSKTKPDPIKGSMEGYSNSVTTLIQGEGDGYDNKDFQHARNNKKQINEIISNQNISNKLSSSVKKNGIITNHSSSFSSNSTAAKLSEHIKTDNLFR
jgi:hypothetical protein